MYYFYKKSKSLVILCIVMSVVTLIVPTYVFAENSQNLIKNVDLQESLRF